MQKLFVSLYRNAANDMRHLKYELLNNRLRKFVRVPTLYHIFLLFNIPYLIL
jgi:hypothetical protein